MPVYTATYIHDGKKFLSNNSAVVINEAGVVLDVLNEIPSNAIQLEGLLCPGFVNAHCHLELSHLKNAIPQHTGLPNFVTQVAPLRNKFSEAEIQTAIATQDKNMQANGIVAVGDICNTIDTLTTKKNTKIAYTNFVECFGIMSAIAHQRFEQAQQTYQQLLKPKFIVPHAPYSMSDALLKLVNESDASTIMTIHNQECQAEDDLIRNGNGLFVDAFKKFTDNTYNPQAHDCSSIAYALQYLKNIQHLLLVHNTFTTSEDVALIKDKVKDPFWVTCPKANLYIENTLPSMYQHWIVNHDIVCVGTDSLASNDTLSVYDEIFILNQHQQIAPEILLQWATYNGALALKQHHLGSFEKSKQPGLVNITNWASEMPAQPIFNIL